MKKIILLALTALMMIGCYRDDAYNNKQIYLVSDYKIKTIEYQGCEYVVMDSRYQRRSIITHKGNCQFCAQRRKQELELLVKHLKEK